MIIVSDIDGVLASFESAWGPFLADISGTKYSRPDDWIPEIWDWDIRDFGKDVVKEGWARVRKSDSFWITLKPMVDVEVGKQFNRLHREHDVFFMTSRCGVGVQRQTSKWLYDNLFISYPQVIVVDRYQDKWKLLEHLKADFFADDKLETVQGWYNHCYMKGIGVGYSLLIDAPYNRDGRTVKSMKIATGIEDALKGAGLWV